MNPNEDTVKAMRRPFVLIVTCNALMGVSVCQTYTSTPANKQLFLFSPFLSSQMR